MIKAPALVAGTRIRGRVDGEVAGRAVRKERGVNFASLIANGTEHSI